MDGFYSIKLTQPTRLTFSYIGYDSRTLDVRSGGTHNIVLTENAQVLDDIVVVGYGKQKKINLTGASPGWWPFLHQETKSLSSKCSTGSRFGSG